VTVRRILIVEDDASARECYGRLFRRHGYEVSLSPSGAWVLANLEGLRETAVILLDYRMPGLTGLELLARMRREGIQAPVFLVSAHVTREMSDEALRLGISRIFHKPVESAALLQSVAEALAHQKEEEGAAGCFAADALI